MRAQTSNLKTTKMKKKRTTMKRNEKKKRQREKGRIKNFSKPQLRHIREVYLSTTSFRHLLPPRDSLGEPQLYLWPTSARRVKVNGPPVRNSQESFMMEMRAARMVQAADSLLKLVSELKQTAIFSGFASLNDHMDQRIEEFNKLEGNTNGTLARIGEEAAGSLKELESH